MSETEDFLAEIGLGGEGQGGDPGQQQQQQETAPESPSFFGEEFTDWGKVKTELPQRLQKLTTLEQELADLKSRRLEYADPEIGEYDAFVKTTGKKDWGAFQRLKQADNIEGLEALVFKTVYENPELAGKEDQIRERLVADYKIDPQVVDPNSVDFALNKKKMEAEAATAKQWLQELKSKVKVDLPTYEQIQQKKAEQQETWKNLVAEAVNQVTKIPVPVWDESGKKVDVLGEFELKDDHRNPFIEPLAQAFSSFQPGENSAKMVSSEFMDRVIARNLPQIISHAIGLREAQIRQELEAKYGGGVMPKPPGGAGSGSKDPLEEYLGK